jgi:NADH-quinone oxidoreductase subunit L
MKIPMICIILAAAALAGLPPLAGFFSKEVIMAGLADLTNPLWLVAGLLGVFLTAYYAFRLIFILLFPKPVEQKQTAPLGAEQHDDNYWVMVWPLIVLAGITVLLGFAQSSLEDFFTFDPAAIQSGLGGHHAWLLYATLCMAIIGVGLAWWEFGRRGASQVGFVDRIPALKALFAERWYLDRFYRHFLDVVIYRMFSKLCTQNDDKVIDGGINGLGQGTVESGRALSFLHTGMVQYKLLVAFVVVVLVALYFFF